MKRCGRAAREDEMKYKQDRGCNYVYVYIYIYAGLCCAVLGPYKSGRDFLMGWVAHTATMGGR